LDGRKFLIDLRVLLLQGAVNAATEALGDGMVVDEELVFSGTMM
jgi:hypothetical protein